MILTLIEYNPSPTIGQLIPHQSEILNSSPDASVDGGRLRGRPSTLNPQPDISKVFSLTKYNLWIGRRSAKADSVGLIHQLCGTKLVFPFDITTTNPGIQSSLMNKDITRIIDRINVLRKERNAVILAHNYQRGEVQDIADHVGDSLELSRKAAATAADVIVFCGVKFMAETAKILSPSKTVLLPDINAGCPMADMLTRRELLEFKREHPGAPVVAYVNCSAEIKAESDICCTSANAVKIVETFPKDQKILFVPDQSLGDWVRRKTGRRIELWPGFCPTHHHFLHRDVDEARAAHPEAELCVHPECSRDIVDSADFVGSTSQIIRRCKESDRREFVIGTEIGILHALTIQNPLKKFHHLSPLGDCPNMKLTSLEKILWSLEDLEHRIELDETTRSRALASVQKMLSIG